MFLSPWQNTKHLERERGKLVESAGLEEKRRGSGLIPLYKPPHPSSLITFLKLFNIFSCCDSLSAATCIRDLIVIYGYVIPVAHNFPTAPKTNASHPPIFFCLLFSKTSLSFSNIVYCSIGLITSTSAGNTPENSARGPSLRRRRSKVDSVEGLPFVEVEVVGRVDDDDDEEEEAAVMRVLITQIGFVMRTVADPARAPQSIDSTVVRALLARLLRRAARVKRERVHSYPLFLPSWFAN